MKFYFENFSNLVPVLSGAVRVSAERDLRDPFQHSIPCWNESKLCAQCSANARTNEAGGWWISAQECRDYCRNGHKPAVKA
jgi:hypothetical protein